MLRTIVSYTPQAMVENRESHPPRQLFPLSRKQAEITTGFVRYCVFNTRDEVLNRWVTDVLSLGNQKSPYLITFQNRVCGEYYARGDGSSDLYSLGVSMAADIIQLTAKRKKAAVPVVESIDLGMYTRFRAKVVGAHPTTDSHEVAEYASARLEELLFRDEEVFRFVFDRLRAPENDAVNVAILDDNNRSSLAYVLGLADGYYPIRYAYDRIRMTRDTESD